MPTRIQRVEWLREDLMVPNYTYTEFEQIYHELAAEYDVTLLPSMVDGIGTERELMQADGIHPTAAEEFVHLAALQRPAPRRALVLGGAQALAGRVPRIVGGGRGGRCHLDPDDGAVV